MFSERKDQTNKNLVYPCSLQGRVVAFDSGSPPRSVTTLARIEVTRNLFTPRWDSLDYSTTVLETLSVGNSVLQVRAFDDDTRVSVKMDGFIFKFQCNQFYSPSLMGWRDFVGLFFSPYVDEVKYSPTAD